MGLLAEIRKWRERVRRNRDTLNCPTCCERIGTSLVCPECEDYYTRGKYEVLPCPVCKQRGVW